MEISDNVAKSLRATVEPIEFSICPECIVSLHVQQELVQQIAQNPKFLHPS